ncbi:Pr6Pr family membrane protein [Streptococcus merionis]|uniref:Pr6Pr family membrane protein n=1 Tax=Streptococcus merionis TaxID=400065 RepID=UPI0026EC7AD0|nr:Pr6Pr family membrane protein [Streptococcus merionis]
MKDQNILYYRLQLVLLSLIGIVLEVVKYGGYMFMYYTILSNAMVFLFMTYQVRLMMTQPKSVWSAPKVLRLKAAVTMAIMITMVVYHFMLAPIADDFWRVENIICHYLVPALMFLDTLIFDQQGQYKIFDPIIWALTPLVYCIFALFNGLVTKIPIPDAKDSPFPYFFINVTKYGWGYVLRWVVVICVAYIIGGYLLYGLKSIRRKERP